MRRDAPSLKRILLVESGPRPHAQRLIPLLRDSVCGDAPIDLFTCVPGEPTGLGAAARTWRSYEVTDSSGRWRLLRRIRRERHAAAAILCGDSPLLATWKLALAALLPAKILLADESGGLVWLDRSNWRKALRIGISRSVLENPEFRRKAAQAASLPFALPVLLAFAARAHAGRLIRATRFTGPPDSA